MDNETDGGGCSNLHHHQISNDSNIKDDFFGKHVSI